MRREDLTRLRWRLRGAWQWPAFVALTVLEAVLLNALPVWGNGPGGLVGGLLIAGSLNLVVVAVLAPLAGRLVRARRPDLPRAIAADYAGTALLGVLLVAFLVGGLANRGWVSYDRHARDMQAFAVAHFIRLQRPAFRSGIARMDTLRLERDMYRSCVPGPRPDRPLCVFVHTDQSPPGITVDPDRVSNAAYRSHGY